MVVALLIMSGCKKQAPAPSGNNNNSTPQKTKRDYLMEGKWQLEERLRITRDSSGQVTSQTNAAPCEKDNIYVFRSYGKMHADMGTLKCDSLEIQIDTAIAWNMPADFSTIMFTHPQGSLFMAYTVQEFTASTIRATAEYSFTLAIGTDTSTFDIEETITYKNVQ